jgi:DNA-binding response OmpR family regulator
MNARVFWTFALACALNIGSSTAASGEDDPMGTMSERIESALQEFESTPESGSETLRQCIDQLQVFTAEADAQSVHSFKARSLVRILAAIERKEGPQFDPNDPPRRNITPPGGQYPSGTAPSSIQDDQTRREYEAALAANKAKIANFNLQVGLARLKEREVELLQALASSPDVDRSRSELTSLFDEYAISEQSRSSVLDTAQDAK